MALWLPLIFCAVSFAAALCLFRFWQRAEGRAQFAEKELAGEQARAAAMKEQLASMRDSQDAFKEYAKAAAFETGQQLSSKLLEDHQRERQQANKHIEEFTKNATEKLMAEQKELAAVIGKVRGDVAVSTQQLQVLVRAMQNPIGAGAEGEISMNNLLQQHGFTEGTDYELQVHLAGEGGNLRPDCVIYLPHQHAVIIDSKASQHIISLFEKEEGTPEFDAAFKELQTSMRAHAKALASKAYQDALKKLKTRNGQPITRTTLVMFIPNDEVVARLMRMDANLMQYLREHDIVLAGKVTLSGLLLALRALVQEASQQEESQAILEICSALMGDVLMSVRHSEKIISGIRGSAKAFDEFSGSMNRALNRMRKLVSKGLTPPKNAAVPASLPRYEVTKVDDVLQGEAEEIPTLTALPKDAA